MSTVTSGVLGIPFVSSQQSQPEVTHNEAIILLQMAVAGGAITVGDNAPPGAPSEGDVYVVGPSPTGLWAGRANCITGYFLSQWNFLPDVDSSGTVIPMGADQEGLFIWSLFDNSLFVWSDQGVSPGVLTWSAMTMATTPAINFGQLCISDNAATIALSIASDSTLATPADYAQITGIWDAVPHGEQNGMTQQTNSVTVGADGIYKIEIWTNVTFSVTNTVVGVMFGVDGVVTGSRKIARKVGTAGDHGNMGGYEIRSLAAGAVISAHAAADKNGNVTFGDAVLLVTELKRTV